MARSPAALFLQSGVPVGRQTPLFKLHQELGARIVDFGGWDMPVQYSSQIGEHHAVRRAAGVFDVSHMCVVDLQGTRVRTLLQKLVGGACDALLFAPVDARRRAAIGGARAGARRGDHQQARAPRDEVELAEPAQVVAPQDLEALRAQEFGGQLFGASSALLSPGEHPWPDQVLAVRC